MAKAQITTKNGTKIAIEGTEDEVAALIARFEGDSGAKPAKRTAPAERSRVKSNSKPTLSGLISELIDGGFFKKPKELGAIKLTLQEQGHFYPTTTLSPVMLRLVRKKELRRIKDNKRWLYVG
jgi:hypothetical protein